VLVGDDELGPLRFDLLGLGRLLVALADHAVAQLSRRSRSPPWRSVTWASQASKSGRRRSSDASTARSITRASNCLMRQGLADSSWVGSLYVRCLLPSSRLYGLVHDAIRWPHSPQMTRRLSAWRFACRPGLCFPWARTAAGHGYEPGEQREVEAVERWLQLGHRAGWVAAGKPWARSEWETDRSKWLRALAELEPSRGN
jgi:hypothetical protein